MEELGEPRAIQRRIFMVRDRPVMLDSDLAELYGVQTKRLLQQVRRNPERFPSDFAFELTSEEHAGLRSQIVTSKSGAGGRRYRPYVFTEQGVAMLSSVLRSKPAAGVNVEIMRAFVELRQMAQSHEALSTRVDQLERQVTAELGSQGEKVEAIFKLLREVTVIPKRKNPAGFLPHEKTKKKKS